MRFFAFLVLAVAVAACAPIVKYHGNEAPDKKLSRLPVGKTTQEQVAKALGTPSYTSFDKSRLWLYISSEQYAWLPTFEREESRRVVVLTFNRKGLLAKKRVLTLAQAQEIAFAPSSIPPPIPTQNWVQRLFSNIGRVTPGAVPGAASP